jgi:N-acyl-D-amino-acid deacylase
MDQDPAAINVGSLVSQGAVRLAVKGFQKGVANAEELRAMQDLVSEAMEAGAFGISTGLNYLPGAFCDRKELIEVTKPVSAYDGMYISHIRTQSEGIFEAIDEAFAIAGEANVGVHISHLKLLGSPVWGKTDELFAKIEAAKAAGLPVSFDAYPYEAGATGLTALLPHWAMEGGIPAMMERLSNPEIREKIRQDCIHGLPGWQAMIKTVGFDNITISDLSGKENQVLIGKTVSEAAQLRGQTAFDTLFDVLLEEEGKASMVISHLSPKDVDAIIAHPDCMIASDSTSAVFGRPHPRFYGTNGKILQTYVREKKLLTLEDAVRKMTALPARQFRVSDRGELREGYFADVLIFDPETVSAVATYEDPARYSVGMDTVIVNGQIAFSQGKPTNVLAGRVLRRAKSVT